MFKKVLSICLVFIFLVSSIPIAAVGSPQIEDPGNVGGGAGGIRRGDFSWRAVRSGYRFTIVDEDFEPVSNVVDILFEKPTVDFGDHVYTASRAHIVSGRPVSGYTLLDFDTLLGTHIKMQPTTPIYFVGTTGRGGGIRFRQWFMAGEGELGRTQAGPVYTPRPPRPPRPPAQQPATPPAPPAPPAQQPAPLVSDLPWSPSAAHLMGVGVPLDAATTPRERRQAIFQSAFTVMQSWGELERFSQDAPSVVDQFESRLQSIRSSSSGSFPSGYTSLNSMEQSALRYIHARIARTYSGYSRAFRAAMFIRVFNFGLNPSWRPAPTTSPSASLPLQPLSSSSPLEMETVAEYDNILEMMIGGDRVFQLTVGDGGSVLKTMVEHRLAVLIEPIFWFRPGAFSAGGKAEPIHDYWVYGTWLNHIRFQQSEGYRFGARGGAYTTVLSFLGWSGMHLSEPVLGLQGFTGTPVRTNLSELFTSVRERSAIGMHLYTAAPLQERPVVEEPVHESSDLTIEESQITRALSTLDASIPTWGERFICFFAVDHDLGCSGHQRTGTGTGTDSDGESYTYSYTYTVFCTIDFGDSSFRYILHNAAPIPSLMLGEGGPAAFMWRMVNHVRSGSISLSGAITRMDDVEHQSTIWRHRDVPTIARYKNPGSQALRELIGAAQNAPRQTSRVQADYQEDVLVQLAVYGGSDLSTYSEHTLDERAVHVSDTHRLINENDNLVSGIPRHHALATVQVHAERAKSVGQAPYPLEQTRTRLRVDGEFRESFGTRLRGSDAVHFHPYVRMRYQHTGDTAGSWRLVYVLAERESVFVPSSFAEVGWRLDDPEALRISSQQWSTHARATRGDDGWQGANQVLPGGALYTLSTPEPARIVAATWQPIITGVQRQALSRPLSSSVYTLARAQEEHTSFIATVSQVLEGLRAVQLVNADPLAEVIWEGDFVHIKDEQIDLDDLGRAFRRLESSPLEKHRLANDSLENRANEGDFDILSATAQPAEFFKIFATVLGDVYMARSLSLESLATVYGVAPQAPAGVTVERILRREEGIGDLRGDTARELDYKTRVIRDLLHVLERNRGSDPTAGGTWYNEAWDGIHVVRQAHTFSYGFGTPASRTSVLDPRLTPIIESRRDLFTSAHVSQFATSERSTSPIAEGKGEGFIGLFKGIDIYALFYDLFLSPRFFIPNATVQDLN